MAEKFDPKIFLLIALLGFVVHKNPPMLVVGAFNSPLLVLWLRFVILVQFPSLENKRGEA